MEGEPGEAVTPGRALAAYAVHAFTASGVVFAFLAAAELCRAAPDPRRVFLFLAIQVLIDAVDGPLARLVDIKRSAPRINGRTIDDLVDYLTYTFVPLMLIWRMGWVPEPATLWVAPAMVASLFGFANTGAKDEDGGFFLGFPSYWNIVAFYVGLWNGTGGTDGQWFSAVLIAALTVLTVLPLRFVYPNLAPSPWRWPTLIGAIIWTIQLAVMFPRYPDVAPWLLWTSLIYPAFYLVLSIGLDLRRRAASREASGSLP